MSGGFATEPEISVIIPVYNVEKYLRKCVDSVLRQTIKEIEVILVDDGSTDGSGLICDEIAEADDRVVVMHKANGGVSEARNRGLEIARGKYIGFVDSDDYVEADMYEYLYGLALRYSADMTQCGIYDYYAERILETKYAEWFEVVDGITTLDRLMRSRGSSFHIFNKLYKKELLKGIRFQNYKVAEDVLFLVETALASKRVVLTNVPKYYYFHRADSLTTSMFSEYMCDAITVYEKVYQIAVSRSPELEKLAMMRRCYCRLLVLDKMYLSCGGYDEKKEREIIRFVRKHASVLLFHRFMSPARRLALGGLMIHKGIYKIVVRQFYSRNRLISKKE